jgi:hypothetical protein
MHTVLSIHLLSQLSQDEPCQKISVVSKIHPEIYYKKFTISGLLDVPLKSGNAPIVCLGLMTMKHVIGHSVPNTLIFVIILLMKMV